MDWASQPSHCWASLYKNGPRIAVNLLESHRVAVVVAPHLKGKRLDGADLLLTASWQPVLSLTLRHDRPDDFRFCLLRESGHAAEHLTTGKAEVGLTFS